jgi:hypothetical protein
MKLFLSVINKAPRLLVPNLMTPLSDLRFGTVECRLINGSFVNLISPNNQTTITQIPVLAAIELYHKTAQQGYGLSRNEVFSEAASCFKGRNTIAIFTADDLNESESKKIKNLRLEKRREFAEGRHFSPIDLDFSSLELEDDFVFNTTNQTLQIPEYGLQESLICGPNAETKESYESYIFQLRSNFPDFTNIGRIAEGKTILIDLKKELEKSSQNLSTLDEITRALETPISSLSNAESEKSKLNSGNVIKL